eukprot:CAMPEP_0184324358 /NCGR_PEP_ID=MMETSP1049-20130417/134786_1 /TAXON_ID=77928 /ORGANISM="Proteomonas sulcata, Strain CCMP704" /LENGTH=132 /DNA_ID=CAMNT_0026646097 /DNA_START=78 /DNA_END=476 /DNA_ORIENTATION=-
MAGKGYSYYPTGAIILDLETGETLKLEEPFKELGHSNGRNIRWLENDNLVALTTDASCEFGSPLLSVYSASNGQVVCRFISPYSANFRWLDVYKGPHPFHGKQAPTNMLVLVDNDGHVIVLDLVNYSPPAPS